MSNDSPSIVSPLNAFTNCDRRIMLIIGFWNLLVRNMLFCGFLQMVPEREYVRYYYNV